jgi:hypothetical protein
MLSTVLVCASRVDEPGFAFNEYWNPLALVIPMTENLPLNPELPIPVALLPDVILLTLTTEPTVKLCGSSDINVATLSDDDQFASLMKWKFL